jgi:hypothetical protein
MKNTLNITIKALIITPLSFLSTDNFHNNNDAINNII